MPPTTSKRSSCRGCRWRPPGTRRRGGSSRSIATSAPPVSAAVARKVIRSPLAAFTRVCPTCAMSLPSGALEAGAPRRFAVTRPGSGPARVPDAGRRRLQREVAEVARLAAEHTLHAVGQVCVAPVEDLGEEVRRSARSTSAGTPCVGELGGEGSPTRSARSGARVRSRARSRRPPRRSVSEARARSARRARPTCRVVGQRRDRDVGDVVGVDERLARRRRPGARPRRRARSRGGSPR